MRSHADQKSRTTVISACRGFRRGRSRFARAARSAGLLGLVLLAVSRAAGAAGTSGAPAGTGTIVVRAQDRQGLPLPGVVIEAKSANGENAAAPIATDREGNATI